MLLLVEYLGCQPFLALGLVDEAFGEGEVEQVVQHELKAILDKMSGLSEEERPMLTYIIVSKRINAR